VRDKQRKESGYVPPPEKRVFPKSKGQFFVEVSTAADQFVRDMAWKRKANPVANKEEQRRTEKDYMFLRKKKKQKELQWKLMQEQQMKVRS